MNLYQLLNQSTHWVPQNGQPVLITDMDEKWRRNAAVFMLRRAATYAVAYELGEINMLMTPRYERMGDGGPSGQFLSEYDLMSETVEDDFDREQRARAVDPEGWLRSTPLWQALTEGLDREGIAP